MNSAAGALADDVRWLLLQLQTAGTLRLRCGGDTYIDAEGATWGTDRFFCGGERHGDSTFACKIGNVKDPRIYQTQRWSHMEFAYRIPLPLGSYVLSLYFQDVWGKTSGHAFDVYCNGNLLLEGYTPRSQGSRYDGQIERFEIEVSDGLAFLHFIPRDGHAAVSAIELRWLGP